MEDSKKKNLSVRAVSSTVFVLIVVTAVLISPFTFIALLLVIAAGAMNEFYKIASVGGACPQRNYGIVFGVLIVLCTPVALLVNISLVRAVFFAALLFLFFITCVVELYRKKDNPLTNISVTIAGILYIAVPLALMPIISMLDIDGFGAEPGPGYRPWVILIYFAIIWMNDAGAYLTGVSFGKHKLFERISPKKSWEGFFGGLVFAVITAVVFALIFDLDMLVWIGLAVVAVVTGVFGDLVESMFKRAAGVKDSGQIMPGHGGYLDRFDSLFFSLPFVFAYLIIFAT